MYINGSIEDVFSLIENDDRVDNHLFTNVISDDMARSVTYLSDHTTKDERYVLIDLDEQEIKRIENMIEMTGSMVESKRRSQAKRTLNKLQKQMNDLKELIKQNPSLLDVLSKTKSELLDNIHKTEEMLKTDDADLALRKYLIMSSIAEEYIYGKIVREISKKPELVNQYEFERFDEVKRKLRYFNSFMGKSELASRDYKTFDEKRFSQALYFWLLTLNRNAELTVCFTNFQNISNPLINRVVNSITSNNAKNLRTMIFTSKGNLLTRMLRDDGIIQESYDYREHDLNRKEKSSLVLE